MLKSSLKKTTALTTVGRGERSLCNDSGSELCLGGEKEKEKCEDARWDEQKREEKAVPL